MGKQHGFARISWWSHDKSESEEEKESASATFSLLPNELSKSMWPGNNFKLNLIVTLVQNQLKMQMSVENVGTTEMSYQVLYHTYFSIPDSTKVAVKGLKGLKYLDKLQEGREFEETEDAVTISKETDRVYKSVLEDVPPFEISAGAYRLTV